MFYYILLWFTLYQLQYFVRNNTTFVLLSKLTNLDNFTGPNNNFLKHSLMSNILGVVVMFFRHMWNIKEILLGHWLSHIEQWLAFDGSNAIIDSLHTSNCIKLCLHWFRFKSINPDYTICRSGFATMTHSYTATR